MLAMDRKDIAKEVAERQCPGGEEKSIAFRPRPGGTASTYLFTEVVPVG